MTTFRTLVVASMLSSFAVATALAQPDPSAAAAGALTAEKVPNTTAVGQTKPPSRDASPTSVKPIDRLTPRQASDDAIATRVCQGCSGGSATSDALSLKVRPSSQSVEPASQPVERAGQPDALPPLSAPPRQSDLDTVALASAHRERAGSVQEKTNGLWQSWLVSVCDGCGDQKAARAVKAEDWPLRDVPLTTGSIDKVVPEKKPHAEARRTDIHPRGTLEANLSPENVNSIRRMPQR